MDIKTEIRTIMDAELTQQAALILNETGSTLADAFRMLLQWTVREHALRFDPLVPNETTVQAMEAARCGDLVQVGSLDDLFTDVYAGDVA